MRTFILAISLAAIISGMYVLVELKAEHDRQIHVYSIFSGKEAEIEFNRWTSPHRSPALAICGACLFVLLVAGIASLATREKRSVERYPCPECGESIPVAAKTCRFCRTVFAERERKQ